MAEGQNKIKHFCRIVDTMYIVLSTLLYRCSECVVNQCSHVSSLWVCHKCDACVTRTSHIVEWLGLKAAALAWPDTALALSNLRPGRCQRLWPGSGLAWPGYIID